MRDGAVMEKKRCGGVEMCHGRGGGCSVRVARDWGCVGMMIVGMTV